MKRLAYWCAVLGLLAVTLFPAYWMVVTSLKPAGEIFSFPPRLLPLRPSLAAFATIFRERPMVRYVLNSLVVSGFTTVLAVTLSALAAYGFTRFEMRGAASLAVALLFVKMLPETLLVVPFFRILSAAGLIDTYVALVLAYSSFAVPFCLWMLIGFFRGIPRAIDEAAVVDGASRMQAFLLVVLPLARPGLAAVGFFTFITAWNSYLWALVLTTQADMFVISVGVANMVGEYRVQWNELMAASVVATVPAATLFLLFSRQLVAAVTAGAVKG